MQLVKATAHSNLRLAKRLRFMRGANLEPSGRAMRRAVFPLSILFALPLWALNPARHVSQYGHTAWRLQDGILPAAPHAIAQTSDGYLWIGTEAGLIRFDGASFSR